MTEARTKLITLVLWAIVWAAESMAALRVAAAWRALRGDRPACTITLASTETVVPEPEPEPESARAALPTEPATTQRPATTAPS